MANEKRLIDAYRLEDLLRSNSGRYHHVDDVIAAIAGQPTVDAVEVVRCKDCKHLNHHCMACNHPYGLIEIIKNSFCSYGERKGNEKENRP